MAKMTRSVRVRCPECRREHSYLPCHYPCACGAEVILGAAGRGTPVRHRTWTDAWAEVACPACGRPGQWPQPEVGCPCGVTLRLASAGGSGPAEEPSEDAGAAAGERRSFQPLTIRTAYDALACAARFLRWLGFTEVHAAMSAPGSGIDLRGPGVVGSVDPATEPTGVRNVETLWLHGLNEAAVPAAFSLAGFDHAARGRAGELGVSLFVFDLAGTPQPVNEAAEALLHTGAPDSHG